MKVQTCQFLCRSSKFKPPQIKLSELFYYDILSQETGDDLGELRCTPTSDLSLNPAVLSRLLDDLVVVETLQHTIITRAHKSTQNLSKQHYICWNRRYRSPVEKATASRGDLGHMGYFALTLNNLLDNNSISHFLALKGHLTFLLHH